MRDKFKADRAGKGRDGWRRGGHKKLFEAFRSDNFTLDENAFPAVRHAEGASRMLDVLEIAVPTLTPEQQKRAAEKLRATEFFHGEPEGIETVTEHPSGPDGLDDSGASVDGAAP